MIESLKGTTLVSKYCQLDRFLHIEICLICIEVALTYLDIRSLTDLSQHFMNFVKI